MQATLKSTSARAGPQATTSNATPSVLPIGSRTGGVVEGESVMRCPRVGCGDAAMLTPRARPRPGRKSES